MSVDPVGSGLDSLNPQLARVLAVPSRVAILRRLRATAGHLTASDLATEIGLHVNTVRAHLEQLVKAGLAVRAGTAAQGPGRPSVGYRATRSSGRAETGGVEDSGVAGGAGNGSGTGSDGFRELAGALVREIAAGAHPARTATNAGRRWACDIERSRWFDRSAEPPDLLATVLRQLGFDPSTEPLGDRIYVHSCPFASLALLHPDVVCAVHLGLLRELLDRAEARVTVAGVDRLVRDDLCLIRLASRASGPALDDRGGGEVIRVDN